MKKCSLCDTLIIGNTCPNCGMRIDSDDSTKYNNNLGGDKNLGNKNVGDIFGETFAGDKSNNNYNKPNTKYIKPKKEKSPSKTIGSILSTLLCLALLFSDDIIELISTNEPEPDYDYQQIAENFQSLQEENSYEDELEDTLGAIMDDLEIPQTTVDGQVVDTPYWQDEYDFLLSQEASNTFYQEVYPGTHIVGLDFPSGDYVLRTNIYEDFRYPKAIILNGENLEVGDDLFLTLNDGDILQILEGSGVSMMCPNHSSLSFLESVEKNEEQTFTALNNTLVAGGDIPANTYDIRNPGHNEVVISVQYPEGYPIEDFEIMLTWEDYFFDNVVLPDGAVIHSDFDVELELSPFSVDSIISQ